MQLKNLFPESSAEEKYGKPGGIKCTQRIISMGKQKFKQKYWCKPRQNMKISPHNNTDETVELKTLNRLFSKQGLHADCLFLPWWLFS